MHTGGPYLDSLWLLVLLVLCLGLGCRSLVSDSLVTGALGLQSVDSLHQGTLRLVTGTLHLHIEIVVPA